VENRVISLEGRAQDEGKSYLEELLREGARKLLQEAIENEVAEYLEIHPSGEAIAASGQLYAMVTIRNGNW
jgi:hypothetical protein